jgi:hypothetical protein
MIDWREIVSLVNTLVEKIKRQLKTTIQNCRKFFLDSTTTNPNSRRNSAEINDSWDFFGIFTGSYLDILNASSLICTIPTTINIKNTINQKLQAYEKEISLFCSSSQFTFTWCAERKMKKETNKENQEGQPVEGDKIK